MRIFAQAIAVLLLAVFLSGSAHAQSLECRGAQKAQQVAELIFGRRIGTRVAVTETQFVLFVGDEITTRFPDGLTVFNATGTWRDKTSNKIMHEPTKIVLIVLPGNADDLARLNKVAEAYKRRFQQQSVGMILRPACVSF